MHHHHPIMHGHSIDYGSIYSISGLIREHTGSEQTIYIFFIYNIESLCTDVLC